MHMATHSLPRRARKVWRAWFNALPPAQRRTLLGTELKHLDMAARRTELKAEKKTYRRLTEAVPGAGWIDAADRRGEQFPPGGGETAMRRASEGVRYGDGNARPRLTPPQCVESEDSLDGMTPNEAQFYDHPPSPSALSFFRHATYTRKGSRAMRDQDGRIGRGRANQGRKKHLD